MTAPLKVLEVWAQKRQALTFFVAGVPAPQPRPRFDGRTGRTYKPTPGGRKTPPGWNKLYSWKKRVLWATELVLAGYEWDPVPAGVPVEVSLDFYYFPPQDMAGSHYAAIASPVEGLGQTFWLLKPSLPDRDNLEKPVLDTISALGEAKVWKDDGQAALGRLVKWYSIDFQGVLIHLATGAMISDIERPNLREVPILDFDDGPGLAMGG